jgi:hypothetical protein
VQKYETLPSEKEIVLCVFEHVHKMQASSFALDNIQRYTSVQRKIGLKYTRKIPDIKCKYAASSDIVKVK